LHTKNSDCNGDGYDDIENWLNELAGDGVTFALPSGGPVCPNGTVEAGEECDDGNADNTDACVAGCNSAECGDGFIRAGVEECDTPNAENQDACLVSCVLADCGDLWVCDMAGCTTGPASGVEVCDDGNTLPVHDGCESNCSRTADTAANTVVQPSFASGMTGWGFYSDNGGATILTTGSRATVTVTTSGGNVQLWQDALSLTAGTCYRLQFDGRIANASNPGVEGDTGDDDVAIHLFLPVAPYTQGMTSTNYNLTPTSRTYTKYFVGQWTTPGGCSTVPPFNCARLRFDFAQFDSPGEVSTFDNIELRVVTPMCGNGILEGPGFEVPCGAETCDDGNAESGDGCSSMCVVEVATPKKSVESAATAGGARIPQ
jgi:cysteine-rich repeat protein